MRERSQAFDPRQVMHTDSFEVFHYREPKPGNVEVHHHDFYEVYYLLSGRVEYWVDGRVLSMEPGDILLIHPMELHRPIVDPESPLYERIVLWIRREYLESLQTPAGSLSRCFAPETPNRIRPESQTRALLSARFSDLVRESYSKAFGAQLAAQGIFLQLMVLLNRQINRQASHSQEEQQLSPLIQMALNYISSHLHTSLTLEEIALGCYVSKYHLSHSFSQEMGISLYRYVMLRRLLMARQMLFAGEPAGQVAAACGFSDYAGFYRAFRAEYGVSPRQFADSP